MHSVEAKPAPGWAEALGGRVVHGEPMSRHTTSRVGGPAEWFVEVTFADDLRDIVLLARQHGAPYLVMGGGSNVLVADAGIRGLVILNKARQIKFQTSNLKSQTVWAESGVILPTLARECVEKGWAGLEWAIGVPGTVGGAVVGNAGAHGGDIAQSLVSAAILDSEGNVRDWSNQELQFGYRRSIIKSQFSNLKRPVVLSAIFGLKQSTRELLESRAAEFAEKRKRTQPPGASMGSMFKNPPGDYAGRLIEAAGLKGVRIGRAEISTLHGNFFVNTGGASAQDVYGLINLAREKVKAQFGVELELEIELVGEW
jgi:UDP-N-acetylmuramate dehydrogenase